MIRLLPATLASSAAARTHKSARPGDDQNPAAPVAERGRRARLRDRTELMRIFALLAKRGHALADAAATGLRPDRGTGIRAMIPRQAPLAARSGASLTPLAVPGLVRMARALARKVSPT
ncbi:hypothetical protein ACGFXB_47365 [Streptomyces canus]|uniref:hypothetical protein n=1 Tax=Streptomyces canus TaxID=58343 RepID=UPI003713D2FF